jgi:cell division protein FtsA
MNEQDVQVGLEIADHEIRLVVGQFFNTRLNILKVERVLSSGIHNAQIVDQAAVIQRIVSAVKHVEENLGLTIERVILSLPSVGLARYVRRINMPIEERVTLRDIKSVYKEALRTELPEHQALVNLAITKSLVNGITMRKLPINEVCDALAVDVDLLCADKEMVYRYVQTVEKAGLQVSEISLDSFAMGKEASLFEKSLEQHLIAVKVERQTTSLSLFAKGKLVSTETINLGSKQIISAMVNRFNLPIDIADRLLHMNARFGLDHYPNTPIYLWSTDGKTHTLSEEDLMNVIQPILNVWVDEIKATISPILETSNAKIVLFGESGEINGFDQLLASVCKCECELYIPETLGVRSSALASVTGLFYVLKDQTPLREFLAGVDMGLFNQMLVKEKETINEDTISGKFKGLFERR